MRLLRIVSARGQCHSLIFEPELSKHDNFKQLLKMATVPIVTKFHIEPPKVEEKKYVQPVQFT